MGTDKNNKNKPDITRRKMLQISASSVLLALTGRGASAAAAFFGFSDTETSSGNKISAWTPWLWRQATGGHFNAGLLSNVDTITSPGSVLLAKQGSNYALSGTITSQVFDSEGSGTRWDALIWDDTPSGNSEIAFQVRASDTPFSQDAASPGWSTAFSTSPVQSGLPSGRYMQWRATLVTDSASLTPALGDVRTYYSGPQTPGLTHLIDIGAISGTAKEGYTLTAGALTPSGATANYQWQKSMFANGGFLNIGGATSTQYTVGSGDVDYYIRVMATGTGNYKGIVASAPSSAVQGDTLQITAIGAIEGIPGIGETLVAGALTPAAATANYQWQRSDSANGTYADISGATSETYTLAAADYEKYIRVTATGYGDYTGTVTSASTSQVAEGMITGISPIVGTTVIGQTLTAGTVYPVGATVTYQWQRTKDGIFVNISGATSSTYTIVGADSNAYIKVVVTGTGLYTGTVFAVTVDPVQSSLKALTAIDIIGGHAEVGKTLTAGTLTPSGATATYKWLRSDTSGGTYTAISGTPFATYTLTTDDYDKYIKVEATGSGQYSGTVASAAAGPIGKGQITDISPITGTAAVGQTLTAGTLTPANATVTWQWQRLVGEAYQNIPGAVSNTYQPTEEDCDAYLKVVATGSGYYTGTVSATTITKICASMTEITAIGATTGIMQVSQMLTAGTLTPSNATATYQWKRSLMENGTYSNISGATSNEYILKASDLNYYIKVTATGSGSYFGTVTSATRGPVTAGELISISPIVGTMVVGQTLKAGTLNPPEATVQWQWRRSDDGGGEFEDITNATSKTYTIQGADSNRYIKVVATGYGAYTGSVSATTPSRASYSSTPLTGIGDISGTAQVGQTLTAGALTPPTASVTYQWQRHDSASGEYDNIIGATSSTYQLTAADHDMYIKVIATGSGAFTGTAASNYIGPVSSATLTAIGATSGTTIVGQVLSAGLLAPSGATADYQWQKSLTEQGTYTSITGAIATTYSLTESDEGYYLRLRATGKNAYTGTVYSEPTGPVATVSTPLTAIGAISGTARVGETLTAGALTPPGAAATYRWLRATSSEGEFSVISGAATSTYTITAADCTSYIKVEAIGSGQYSGTLTSAAVGPVAQGIVTGIGPITGSVIPPSTLTAGAVSPAGATVTYQWQYSDSGAGTIFDDIPGATGNTYYVTTQYNYRYIRVVVTGTGAYTGTASARTEKRVGGAA